MTASSHPHPFGFHASGPTLAAPMPLRQVPALQTAVAPAAPAATVVGAVEPLFPMCATCGNRRGPWTPRGEERYRSGAQVFVCRDGCEVTPVQAAAGVIGAAMDKGVVTPQELAQVQEDAGLLFDPQRAKDIETAAAAQTRAEMRAELEAAAEAAEAAEWFHGRLLATAPLQEGNRAVRRLCGGRRPDDCLTVTEVLRAVDGAAPAPAPLTVTWDGRVSGSPEDRPGEATFVGCTAALGGSVVLALDDDQRVDLAVRLLATVPPAVVCGNTCCGTPTRDLIESDPKLWGGIVLDVVGTDSGKCWWCSPACAIAAMKTAGDELQTADHLAVIDPDQQTPEALHGGDPLAYGPTGIRCGCGKDAHSNLVPCQGDTAVEDDVAPQGDWGVTS